MGVPRIVNAQAGANMAEAGPNLARCAIFAEVAGPSRPEFATTAQPFCRIGVTESCVVCVIAVEF